MLVISQHNALYDHTSSDGYYCYPTFEKQGARDHRHRNFNKEGDRLKNSNTSTH